MDWRHGASGRVPALKHEALSSPRSMKKEKKKKDKIRYPKFSLASQLENFYYNLFNDLLRMVPITLEACNKYFLNE
jgi:hypothetical protein